jgi:type I restriction enzyme S subunit
LNEGKPITTILYISCSRYNEIEQQFGVPKRNDILISAVGTIGVSWIVDDRKFYFKDGNLLWIRNISINSQYLKFVLDNIFSKDSFGHGGAYNALTIEKLKQFDIPLPPLAEQRRIVSVIESAFALIDEIEDSKTSLQQIIKQAKAKTLDLAIKGKLVSVSPAPTTADNSPYQDLKEGWKVVKLGEVCEIISGTSYNKNNIATNGIRVLRGGNVQDNKLFLFDDDVIIENSLIDKNKEVKYGDIVIVASTGSEILIGKPGYADKDFPNCQIGAFLRIIRPKQKELTSFLRYVFESDYYREYIRNLAKGTNINNIKNEYLNNFDVPLPPLAEQQLIVAQIETIFAQLDDIEKEVK